MYYNVPVTISKQEDGLWRVEAPSLPGCFVDDEKLEQALADIHEGVAMFLDVLQQEGTPPPADIVPCDTLPLALTVLVAPSEHSFRRFPLRSAKTRRERKPALPR